MDGLMDGMDGERGAIMDGERGGSQLGGQEEFEIRAVHWAIMLVLIFGGWCLWTWFSGGGGSDKDDVTAARPAAEDLRRKRLAALEKSMEALERSMSEAEVDPVITGYDATPAVCASDVADASVKQSADRAAAPPDATLPAATEGLRRRGAAPSATAATLLSCTSESTASADPKPTVEPSQAAPRVPDVSSIVASTDAPSSEPVVVAKDEPAVVVDDEPVAVAEAKPKKSPDAAAVPSTFSVTIRGIVRGSTTVRTIDSCKLHSTVETLHERATTAFELGPETHLRLFLNGKELKAAGPHTLGDVGIVSGSTVQIMVVAPKQTATPAPLVKTNSVAATPAPIAATAIADSTAVRDWARDSAGIALHSAPSFAVRALGSAPGRAQEGLSIEGLTDATTVRQLEGKIGVAFGVGGDVRMRLILMGKELKVPDIILSDAGVKSGVTIQAMFSESAGKPMQAAADVSCGLGGCSVGGADGLAGGSISAVTPLAMTSQTTDSSGAIANGLAGSATEESVPVSREEAWRAMADLEAQLARATNPSEDEQSRQASTVLKQMLVAATHGSNPQLLQFAKTMVPDISKIWSCESTREYLVHILVPTPVVTPGGSSGSNDSAAAAPIGSANPA